MIGEVALCPFCGHASHEESLDRRWQFARAFECDKCGAHGPRVEVQVGGCPARNDYDACENEARRLWNQRTLLVTYAPNEPGAITVNGKPPLDADTEHALRSAIDSLEYHNALLREGGGKLLARAEAAEKRLDKVGEFAGKAIERIQSGEWSPREAVINVAREVLGK